MCRICFVIVLLRFFEDEDEFYSNLTEYTQTIDSQLDRRIMCKP